MLEPAAEAAAGPRPTPSEVSLASAAISLRRIADAFETLHQKLTAQGIAHLITELHPLVSSLEERNS